VETLAQDQVERVVALGASNLTRGLAALVSGARGAWGNDVEVLAALGLGRSYGEENRVLLRTLPSILECGLWAALERLPKARTRALVTDVGNDIAYGSSAERILRWVDECLARLRRVTDDIVLTDLPLDNLRRLSPAAFLVVRGVFYPGRRLTLEQALRTAEETSAGLADLARGHGARLVRPRPGWYGRDPIHVCPGQWASAWATIALGEDVPRDGARGNALARWAEWARLYALPCERRWLLGRERVTPQDGRRLRAGGRLWLY
jgi:hypothetical protein